MSEPTSNPSHRPAEFVGREALDQSWAKFRKAGVDLLREGAQSPDALEAHVRITKEATAVLNRLAAEARKATAASRKKRTLSADARLLRVVRRGARQGSPAMARMLDRLEGGAPDDAA